MRAISEFHQCAYSHCFLLWCEKGIVYQQVIGILVYIIGRAGASPPSRATGHAYSRPFFHARVRACVFLVRMIHRRGFSTSLSYEWYIHVYRVIEGIL